MFRAKLSMHSGAALVLSLVFFSHDSYALDERVAFGVGKLQSQYGCQLSYEYYKPDDNLPVATLILAHGFMRDLASQRGWAQQWLDYNIATVVVSFCNSTLFNGHHSRNADDLIAMRHHLDIESTIYAGFSAGGLAAYLAALRDEHAIGYLGFDSVDSGKLAMKESVALSIPALFLLAPSSSCNARSNMLPTIERHGYAVDILPQVTHCYFESPFDSRCAWVCGKSKADVALEQAKILASAAAFIIATTEGQQRTLNR